MKEKKNDTKQQQRILYSSTEVRQAIIRLFSSSNERRVAIAAFVGQKRAVLTPMC